MKDYEERVYAGVLGKVIAVYLGRPYEGWRYDKISVELGDIEYYVNDRKDVALKHHLLVVVDDDISGTFLFPRALEQSPEPSSVEVGQTWLNEIVQDAAVLWWGGIGNSTEHTAYLRMKAGVRPPESGSIERNGKVVAEQVGAQIFVEGFAMTRPGDLRAAADLAERAARVSHDGEAVHAARVVAALVAGAFVERDMDRLLDEAVTLIPADSLIARIHRDVRGWAQGGDWKATRDRIDERYGYHLYGGNCHVVPNHATVINALAHSRGEFASAMTVVNTSGWDTDSNAGNVGAICGVFGGLEGLSTRDWRGPIADRMYLPAADGGSFITDAAREAVRLAAHGRRWAGEEPLVPKGGARFHFFFHGSVQGFQGTNINGRLAFHGLTTTPTFLPLEAHDMPIYGVVASPTLYSGQTVRAAVQNATAARLVARVYDGTDELREIQGPWGELEWTIPDTDGQPVAEIGVEAQGEAELDWLTWDGAPDTTLTRPAGGGTMWRRAWVKAVDRWDERWPEPFRIVQNTGTGLLIQGERGWRDYNVTADVTPHLAREAGIAARVQGLTRYYALKLVDRNRIQLTRHDEVIASQKHPWEYGTTYELSLSVEGNRLTATVDGKKLLEAQDDHLTHGGVGLLVTEGRTATQRVTITPPAKEQ